MADPLDTYRSKRDFERTTEPSGGRRVAPAERLRFVIQKHAATRLHYDFRLEWEGVLKSWAVTRGPSLDPHARRLAVEVEDHPLDYGDFEGTIPKGQYGGGTVMLWDRGWWAPEDGTSPEAGLRKGHLSFQLDGEKLHGRWSLVRMKPDEARPGQRPRTNWLLIKHEDDAARPGDHDEFLDENDRSAASGRTMAEIAEGKGRAPKPFIGARKGSAKAVWDSDRKDPAAEPAPAPAKASARRKATKASGPMPAFVEPELCKLIDRPPAGPGWAHEIKFDGYRMQLRVQAGQAVLRTRKGLDWTARFPEIAADAQGLPDALLDGEIVALDAHGNPDFAGLQAALSDGKTSDLVYFLFDALFADGRDLRPEPLAERKAALRALLDASASLRLKYTEHFEAAGQAVLESACRMHLEGVVSKRLDAPYRAGRTGDWTKAKCRGGQEVVIGGWSTTEGRFRSLLAGFERDGKLIYAGRVGTGFSRDTVERLLPRLKAVAADASPFAGANAPKKAAGVHWVRPELVAEIDYAGLTADGNIRQASFKGLREDKPAAEVTGDAVEAEASVTVPAKPAPKPRRGGAVVHGVSISNPDKALWPADATGSPITKLELAQYLDAVGAWMLPYVRGRPCSIVRTPDGIDSQRFFQRHAGAGTSSLITLTTVSGDRQPYLQFDTVESLVAAAQAGTTELHPWNCAPGRPDLPGRFVFDLDPDEALPFDRVLEAAREVRDRLEAVGLTSVLKTTGGKGLHVVAPFTQSETDPVAWPQAKAFAKDLCEAIARDQPDAYTTNMSKKARPGRIFLDYLRNDRMASAVALLSPRARAGAPVSFPVAWTQARNGLNPKDFTLRTAPALMAERDPWDGWEAAARPLREAIDRLRG
jgi:bifunctional non-homologous end joining protein LigD